MAHFFLSPNPKGMEHLSGDVAHFIQGILDEGKRDLRGLMPGLDAFIEGMSIEIQGEFLWLEDEFEEDKKQYLKDVRERFEIPVEIEEFSLNEGLQEYEIDACWAATEAYEWRVLEPFDQPGLASVWGKMLYTSEGKSPLSPEAEDYLQRLCILHAVSHFDKFTAEAAVSGERLALDALETLISVRTLYRVAQNKGKQAENVKPKGLKKKTTTDRPDKLICVAIALEKKRQSKEHWTKTYTVGVVAEIAEERGVFKSSGKAYVTSTCEDWITSFFGMKIEDQIRFNREAANIVSGRNTQNG